MHRAIYRLRSDVRAVVHTHSTYATMFACAGEEIPAVHYLIAEIGDRVPVADYAVYGSEELARNAVEALRRAGANGALLKNHGVIAVGESLSKAYVRAEIIETVAQLAFGAKMIGRWELLTPEQLEETRKTYERAIAVYPTFGKTFFLLGTFYRDHGEPAKAREAFEQAARLAYEHSIGMNLEELREQTKP